MSSLGIRTGSLVIFTAVTALLSGCGSVPGQRMITPAAIQDTGGDYSTEPSQQQQIPITDINLALLRQMRTAQTSAALPPQTLGLFGKPTAYKVGPGDVLQIVVWDHPELAAALGQPLDPRHLAAGQEARRLAARRGLRRRPARRRPAWASAAAVSLPVIAATCSARRP